MDKNTQKNSGIDNVGDLQEKQNSKIRPTKKGTSTS